MLFTPTLYPNIKGVFDRMREADNHLLALKASKELDQAAIEGMKKGMLNEGH
jgi:hypothetical protein